MALFIPTIKLMSHQTFAFSQASLILTSPWSPLTFYNYSSLFMYILYIIIFATTILLYALLPYPQPLFIIPSSILFHSSHYISITPHIFFHFIPRVSYPLSLVALFLSFLLGGKLIYLLIFFHTECSHLTFTLVF